MFLGYLREHFDFLTIISILSFSMETQQFPETPHSLGVDLVNLSPQASTLILDDALTARDGLKSAHAQIEATEGADLPKARQSIREISHHKRTTSVTSPVPTPPVVDEDSDEEVPVQSTFAKLRKDIFSVEVAEVAAPQKLNEGATDKALINIQKEPVPLVNEESEGQPPEQKEVKQLPKEEEEEVAIVRREVDKLAGITEEEDEMPYGDEDDEGVTIKYEPRVETATTTIEVKPESTGDDEEGDLTQVTVTKPQAYGHPEQERGPHEYPEVAAALKMSSNMTSIFSAHTYGEIDEGLAKGKFLFFNGKILNSNVLREFNEELQDTRLAIQRASNSQKIILSTETSPIDLSDAADIEKYLAKNSDVCRNIIEAKDKKQGGEAAVFRVELADVAEIVVKYPLFKKSASKEDLFKQYCSAIAETQTLKMLPMNDYICQIKEEIIEMNETEKIINCYCAIVEQAQHSLEDLVKNVWADQKVRDEKREYFSSQKLAYYFFQAMCGTEYLHQRNTYFGDMKPANLLIFRNQQVKIGDLGISVKLGLEPADSEEELYQIKGSTPGFFPQKFFAKRDNGSKFSKKELYEIDHFAIQKTFQKVIDKVALLTNISEKQPYQRMLEDLKSKSLTDTISAWAQYFMEDPNFTNQLCEQLLFENKPSAIIQVLKITQYKELIEIFVEKANDNQKMKAQNQSKKKMTKMDADQQEQEINLSVETKEKLTIKPGKHNYYKVRHLQELSKAEKPQMLRTIQYMFKGCDPTKDRKLKNIIWNAFQRFVYLQDPTSTLDFKAILQFEKMSSLKFFGYQNLVKSDPEKFKQFCYIYDAYTSHASFISESQIVALYEPLIDLAIATSVFEIVPFLYLRIAVQFFYKINTKMAIKYARQVKRSTTLEKNPGLFLRAQMLLYYLRNKPKESWKKYDFQSLAKPFTFLPRNTQFITEFTLDNAQSYLHQSAADQIRGDHKKALESENKALRIFVQIMGEGAFQTAQAQKRISALYYANGNKIKGNFAFIKFAKQDLTLKNYIMLAQTYFDIVQMKGQRNEELQRNKKNLEGILDQDCGCLVIRLALITYFRQQGETLPLLSTFAPLDCCEFLFKSGISTVLQGIKILPALVTYARTIDNMVMQEEYLIVNLPNYSENDWISSSKIMGVAPNANSDIVCAAENLLINSQISATNLPLISECYIYYDAQRVYGYEVSFVNAKNQILHQEKHMGTTTPQNLLRAGQSFGKTPQKLQQVYVEYDDVSICKLRFGFSEADPIQSTGSGPKSMHFSHFNILALSAVTNEYLTAVLCYVYETDRALKKSSIKNKFNLWCDVCQQVQIFVGDKVKKCSGCFSYISDNKCTECQDAKRASYMNLGDKCFPCSKVTLDSVTLSEVTNFCPFCFKQQPWNVFETFQQCQFCSLKMIKAETPILCFTCKGFNSTQYIFEKKQCCLFCLMKENMLFKDNQLKKCDAIKLPNNASESAQSSTKTPARRPDVKDQISYVQKFCLLCSEKRNVQKMGDDDKLFCKECSLFSTMQPFCGECGFQTTIQLQDNEGNVGCQKCFLTKKFTDFLQQPLLCFNCNDVTVNRTYEKFNQCQRCLLTRSNLPCDGYKCCKMPNKLLQFYGAKDQFGKCAQCCKQKLRTTTEGQELAVLACKHCGQEGEHYTFSDFVVCKACETASSKQKQKCPHCLITVESLICSDRASGCLRCYTNKKATFDGVTDSKNFQKLRCPECEKMQQQIKLEDKLAQCPTCETLALWREKQQCYQCKNEDYLYKHRDKKHFACKNCFKL